MNDLERCYAAALRILHYRFNSEAELRRKLRRKEFEEGVVEATLVRLREEQWLDDERFAGAFVRTRSAKRIGRLRIARELQAAGVEPEAVSRALNANLDAELEKSAAFEAARKRTAILVRRHGEDYLASPEGRSRLAGWLIARGYDSQSVWDIVQTISRRRSW
jgi:SOS response regulatory protein OraA/RecX